MSGRRFRIPLLVMLLCATLSAQAQLQEKRHIPLMHAPQTPLSADVIVRNTLSNGGPLHPGDRVAFTIVVGNNGPATAEGIRLALKPENLKVVHVSAKCDGMACVIVDLRPQATSTMAVEAQIIAAGSFSLTAAATSRSTDSLPKNNIQIATGIAELVAPPLPALVDLSVQSQLSPGGPYFPGEEIAINVVVGNRGPAIATNVRVTNALTGLQWEKAQGQCDIAACMVTSLDPGQSTRFTIRARIGQQSEFGSSTSVASTQDDSDPGNNTSVTKGVVSPPQPPNLSADVTVRNTLSNGGSLHPGDRVAFTIVVGNNGPATAEAIRLALKPENLKIVHVSAKCDGMACVIADLRPQVTSTIQVEAQIITEGNFSLTAAATSRSTDPLLQNNAQIAGAIAERVARASATPMQGESGPGNNASVAGGGVLPPQPPGPRSPIRWIAAALAIALLAVSVVAWSRARWRRRIHCHVQLDVADRCAGVGPLRATRPSVNVQVSVLTGRSEIGSLLLTREETCHD